MLMWPKQEALLRSFRLSHFSILPFYVIKNLFVTSCLITKGKQHTRAWTKTIILHQGVSLCTLYLLYMLASCWCIMRNISPHQCQTAWLCASQRTLQWPIRVPLRDLPPRAAADNLSHALPAETKLQEQLWKISGLWCSVHHRLAAPKTSTCRTCPDPCQ